VKRVIAKILATPVFRFLALPFVNVQTGATSYMKKIICVLTFAICATAQVYTQTLPNIIESRGWLESAFVKWAPVENAESYNVYYSGEGITDKKIDNQLIRNYGDYYRADVMGLTSGTYTIKVTPVFSGVEGTGATTGDLTVNAHDRSGFAFMNGHIPGAYNASGTLKNNAVVVYLTENNKNTVSMGVVTSAKGQVTTCTGIQNILDGYKKGYDARPLAVRMIGQLKDPAYLLAGDIVIENKNNESAGITFEGVGDDAVADGFGIRIKNATNIEIRNIGFMNCNSSEHDNIGLQQNNTYVWVHNCDLFYGEPGSDSDQAKGDGALDCKLSNYVTFSYNHYWDSGKSNLLGLSGGAEIGAYATYHHNWYDHSDSRHPRVRYYTVHVYNNYYDGISKYGVGATCASSIFVENNYFRNCKYPMLISMQGSDVWNAATQSNDYKNAPTFSKEDGGIIKAYNNYMEGQARFIAYGATSAGNYNTKIDFDAYVAANRNEVVPNTVKSYQGANLYNNFDTNNAVMYNYTADTPEDAKANVMTYAGRILGGDFQWTFNNAVDDASSDVNAALKTALENYKTKLINVQGDAPIQGGEVPTIKEPYLNDPENITDTGFDINWDAVDGAIQYVVSISHVEQSNATIAPIFEETFNRLTTAVTGNALATGSLADNGASKYKVTGGGSNMACKENGTMDLNGGRFSILNLDLSFNPVLYLTCEYVSGSGKFLVSVNYEGTSGSTGNVYSVAANTIPSTYTTLAIPLTGGTSNSFIQLRTESSTVIRIDNITISTSNPLPQTVTETYTVNAPETAYSFVNLIPDMDYTVNVVAKSATETSLPSNNLYVTTLESAMAINSVKDNAAIREIQYYTITGIRIKSPVITGVYIKKTIYENGIDKSEKIFIKRM